VQSHSKTEELRMFLESVVNNDDPTPEELKKFKAFFPAAAAQTGCRDYAEDLWMELHDLTSDIWPIAAGLQPDLNKHDALATIESIYSDIILASFVRRLQLPHLVYIEDALSLLKDDIQQGRLRRCANSKCTRAPYFIKRRELGRPGSRNCCSRECYIESVLNPQKAEWWRKNRAARKSRADS
jgi:hypothetical protein